MSIFSKKPRRVRIGSVMDESTFNRLSARTAEAEKRFDTARAANNPFNPMLVAAHRDLDIIAARILGIIE